MTDPGSELAQRAAWEAGYRRALLDDQCRRADAEAEAPGRAAAAQAADKADAAMFAAWKDALTGKPPLTHEAMLQRSRDAADGPVRDPSVPLGSAENPVQFVDWTPIGLGAPQVRRSDDGLLRQAKQLSADLARYRRPRGRREISRSAIARSEQPHCPLCEKLGFSPDNSVLAHHDPEFGEQVEAEGRAYAAAEAPDEPPARLRSSWQGEFVRCGTGWPGR